MQVWHRKCMSQTSILCEFHDLGQSMDQQYPPSP